MLECLDRFYVGAWASVAGGSMMTWCGTLLSDHTPVSLRLIAQHLQAPRRGFWIPDYILIASSLHDHIVDLWSPPQDTHLPDLLAFLVDWLVAFSEACRSLAIARCRSLQASEQGLHSRLASVHHLASIGLFSCTGGGTCLT